MSFSLYLPPLFDLLGLFVFFLFLFLAAPCAAYRILVPRPGIEPVPPTVEAWSPNHWTAREVLTCCLTLFLNPDDIELFLK